MAAQKQAYKGAKETIKGCQKGKRKIYRCMSAVNELTEEDDPDDDTTRESLSCAILRIENPKFKRIKMQGVELGWCEIEHYVPPTCIASELLIAGKGEYMNNCRSRDLAYSGDRKDWWDSE